MVKIGRVITDPSVGTYCRLTLPGGEKLLVSHETQGKHGKLSVALVKLWGFSSEPIFDCSLDTPEGQALAARLAAGAAGAGTPLDALVHRLAQCDSLAAARAACRALAG